MNPDDLPGTDPNTLPYFITEAHTGRVVPVRFEWITPADQAELRNEDWQQAVFRDVWPELINDATTLKLVCVSGEDARIQGMILVGRVTRYGTWLKKNLLEAAPFNQHGRQVQIYRGVGRVLVARLIAESVLQGGQGRVLVKPRKRAKAFYRVLGFKEQQDFRLGIMEAETLLQSTLLRKPEG